MKTRIISGFPGIGKSYYHKKYPKTTLDSDSSWFSWIRKPDGKKVRDPDFPNNYIKHIKENIGKYEFIFVSTHKEVRDVLKENCIFFYLVYPDRDQKERFLKLYTERGSDKDFIKLLSDNWDIWIKKLEFCETGCKQIRMILPTLEQELNHLIASENGEK